VLSPQRARKRLTDFTGENIRQGVERVVEHVHLDEQQHCVSSSTAYVEGGEALYLAHELLQCFVSLHHFAALNLQPKACIQPPGRPQKRRPSASPRGCS
jgi:hypothetical protein